MMSIFDIIYSINKALTFLTYPSDIGVPTFGNDTTCAVQGFFTQFGYATGSYNLVLSIYYYLIINRGMSKEEFTRVWEKALHSIVVTCHLSFAIIGVSIGLFNPTPAFCYIAPGPYGCEEDPNLPCHFERSAAFFYEAFAQGWIQLAYVVIIVTNLLIWLSVRKQEREMEKYQFQLESIRLSAMEEKSSYARNVFIQSILYVGAFVLTWSWATIFHLVWWITGVSASWITLLINTFIPLQGFFNAFIYARPRYIRLKKMHGDLSFQQLITLVFLPESSSMPEEVRNRRSTVGRSTMARSYIRSFRFGSGSPCIEKEILSKSKKNQNEDDSTESSVHQRVDEEVGKNEEAGLPTVEDAKS